MSGDAVPYDESSLPASEVSPTSDTPCSHLWVSHTIALGEILGTDSEGCPVFVEHDRDTVYGCELCDVAWTPGLEDSSGVRSKV